VTFVTITDVHTSQGVGGSRGAVAVVAALVLLGACAGVDPESRQGPTSAPVSMVPPTTLGGRTTTLLPTTLAGTVAPAVPPSSIATTSAPPSPNGRLLADVLLPVPGYTYPPASQTTGTGEFAEVEQSAETDVQRNGRIIARMEVDLIEPEYRDASDDQVLDFVADLSYGTGQTEARLSLPDEQLLVRRLPDFVAWTWVQSGVVFNVVANGVDPSDAGAFVAALSALQHQGHAANS
jgi:hypothetical protein